MSSAVIDSAGVAWAQMMADEQREVDEIGPGHIGAIAGLKVTCTGETLCLRGDPRGVVLDGVKLPRPVFSASLEVSAGGARRIVCECACMCVCVTVCACNAG